MGIRRGLRLRMVLPVTVLLLAKPCRNQDLGKQPKKIQCVSWHSQGSRITMPPTDDSLTHSTALLGPNFCHKPESLGV